MYSPRSDQAPTTAEALGALRTALQEVAEKSLCAFTDLSDRARFEEAWKLSLPKDPEQAARESAPAEGDVWYSTSVEFEGPFLGEVALLLPRSLTLELYRNFAGMNFDDYPPESELRDFAGECANVLCGHWLTRTYPQLKFDLAPPKVDVLLPEPMAPVAGIHDMGVPVFMSINDIPIQMVYTPRSRRAASGM